MASDGKTVTVHGLAVGQDETHNFHNFSYESRPIGEQDVHVHISHCGVCHSDIHTIRGEWGPVTKPCIPGHEMVGKVSAVGSKVTKHKLGDYVGVGCYVLTCQDCKMCNADQEQYCTGTPTVFTYNAKYPDGHVAQGGYSSDIVVHENYVVKVPSNLSPAGAAPLLCAGVTVFNPMKAHGLKKTDKFGVVGLGGLGHCAVKFGLHMAKETVVISRNSKKKEDAQKLGTNSYLAMDDEESVKAALKTFDFLLITISADYDINKYTELMAPLGKIIVVGIPPSPATLSMFPMIMKGISLSGSLIGGIKITQEMLDFAGEHDITADIELIDAEPAAVDKAHDRVVAADVRYRFVIDSAKLHASK